MSADELRRSRPHTLSLPRLIRPAGFSAGLAAAVWLLAAPLPAAAFSQIGSQDGSDRQKDGIVSVPLPPLPGSATPPVAERPAVTPSDAAPTGVAPAAAAPASPVSPAAAPTAPATPPSSGAPAASPLTAPAPPSAEPAPDDGTTDEGEAPAETDDPGEGAADPAAAAPDGDPAAAASANTPPAQIFYGDDGLPPAVRDLRQKLIEICRSGDIEALRPYLQGGEDATVLTFGGAEGDPITLLKSASGDGEGVEMLAILLEVLQAGHVRSEPDTDGEIFVWPYFTGVPIDKLTNPQKVELFELVTAGDYQEMLGFGAYNFYRVGISPDGKLQFFVAGD